MLRTLSLRTWAVAQPLKGLLLLEKILSVPCMEEGKWVKLAFDKMKRERGLKFAILYFKNARWILIKNLVGDPVPQGGAKVDRYGFPVRVLPLSLRTRLRNSPGRLDCALAIFLSSVFTLYKGKCRFSPDYSKITEPGVDLPSSFIGEFFGNYVDILKSLGLTNLRLKPHSLICSNRAGPNGHAMLCAHLDAVALTKATGDWLRSWIVQTDPGSEEGLKILSTVALSIKVMSALVGEASVEGLRTALSIGRVALKPEHGKVRIFAISDYWTQVAMRPLHDALMSALRSIPMDATFSQESGAETVKRWTAEGKKLFCYDLSSATDRFPAFLQAVVLNYLLRAYGKRLGFLWRSILTERDYRCPDGRSIRYVVGQPMGTLSSWAAFALTHHVVVQLAARRAGVTGLFKDYALLGDDIAIAHEPTARAYLAIMAEIGVSISYHKSITGSGRGEFAKRTFLRGEELTGLSWDLFSLASKTLLGLYALIEHLKRRDYEISMPGLLAVILGRATDRKRIGAPVANLLAALTSPLGPVTDISFWWRARNANTAGELRALTGGEPGSHTAEAAAIEKHCEDSIALKGHGAKASRIISGYFLAMKLLKDSDKEFLRYFSEAWQRASLIVKGRGGVLAPLPKLEVPINWDFHPAKDVFEDGLDPHNKGGQDAQELRLFVRSGEEDKARIREILKFAGGQRRAVAYEREALENQLIFF